MLDANAPSTLPELRPWPFPPPIIPAARSAPTWTCPEGLCDCHPTNEVVDTIRHTIVLHDPQGVRMMGARCMVYEGGRAITPPKTAADAAGELHLDLKPTTRSLFVEWCAPDMAADRPYQKLYHVVVDTQPVPLRLANIGFATRPRLEDNVLDYQRAFAERETGHADDIAPGLKIRHDNGGLTPFVRRPLMDRPPETSDPAILALHKDGSRLDGPKLGFGDSATPGSSKAKLGPDKPAQGGPSTPGGPNAQGAVVPNVGQLLIVAGVEPNDGKLTAANLTLRLWPVAVPGLPEKDRDKLIKPTLVGITWGDVPAGYVICGFKDLLAGTYVAIAHADKVKDVPRGYALGSTDVIIKVGLMTLAYVPLTRDRAILTAADPLLELDVEVMQRRRKVLATIHTLFPQSADTATAPADMPPYDQGAYKDMVKGLDATNTCAPINTKVMGEAGAVGSDYGFNQVIEIPIPENPGHFKEIVPPQFVEYSAGAVPSVGDCFLGTDKGGMFHHCGVVVRSNPTLGTLWLTADGGQPDRTSPFEQQNGKWRRYYNPPKSREAAYIVPRLFHGDGGTRVLIGNRFIFPGLTPPWGDYVRGWTDITHPAVRFQSAFTAKITLDDFRAFKERVLKVEKLVEADIQACREKEALSTI